DVPAVGLGRVSREVFLVVVFGDVEGAGGDDVGDDGVIEELVPGQAGDHLLGRGLLLRRVVEDGRAVLCADIVALTVQGGRIVDGEEDFEDVPIGGDLRIEGDPHDLGMTGSAGADLLIGRVWRLSAHVAGFDGLHAFHPVVHG